MQELGFLEKFPNISTPLERDTYRIPTDAPDFMP